jgi:hypothetical protein
MIKLREAANVLFVFQHDVLALNEDGAISTRK